MPPVAGHSHVAPSSPEIQRILDCFGEDHERPSDDFIAKMVKHERLMREFERKQREKIALMPAHRRARELAELEKFLDPHGLRTRGE